MNKLLRYSCILLVPALVLSCEKTPEPAPAPEPEKSLPEQVEGDLMDILSRDWKSLSDTLDFFYNDMLIEGRTSGIGSDGVYYELSGEADSTYADLNFYVEDSLWANFFGSISPEYLMLSALDATVEFEKKGDMLAVTLDEKIRAEFSQKDTTSVPVSYCGEAIGYIDLQEFENTDFSTGKYPVMHYYGDVRTFSFYENLHFLSLYGKSRDIFQFGE